MAEQGRVKVVIDTNVILFDAQAICKFHNADVHIPISVIEEIDRFKRDLSEVGRNARYFSRFIDVLRSKGSLAKGVDLGHNAFVYINSDDQGSVLPTGLDVVKTDNRILSTALALQNQYVSSSIQLITKDINLRIKADVFGIEARDYEEGEHFESEEMYKGYVELEVEPEQIETFYRQQSLVLPKERGAFYPYQYLLLKDCNNPDHSAIGYYSKEGDCMRPLKFSTKSIWGIHACNVEQSFAFDALLNDDILLVSLVGKAGTGKTLLAIAAGLHKTLEENKFQRLLVSRPIFPMGRDIGYLPGDIEQKLNPWMQPIFDNVEFLLGVDKKAAGRVQELINQGMLNIEPLTYIRGRSIPNQYLIVDEAQNLTPHEIKTIITRAGRGTKIVLTGDCYQIDNPYVDFANSGLTHAVERFKAEDITAHITLKKGERSKLAELAANIL